MAAKPFKSLFRGAGRNALDLPVAGLSALAAAFAAFAVPQDLLSRAVVATGLPSILSAAQPPLGLTARVAVAVGSAALVFGIVFLALRLFDRSGMSTAAAKEEEDFLSPRVRRRDVHPDAPTPRPISAARDFGEPVSPTLPVPRWLDEAKLEAVPELAPEPEVGAEPLAFIGPEPEPEAEPEVVPEPESFAEPEPFAEVQPAVEAEPDVVAYAAFEPEPFPETEPEVAMAPEAVLEAEVAAQPEPEPAPAIQAEMPASIAALMERLEQGLARRRMIESAPAIPAPPPQVFPEAAAPAEAADDRLQSAIASLQRLAARSS